jgi:hypothetical protein
MTMIRWFPFRSNSAFSHSARDYAGSSATHPVSRTPSSVSENYSTSQLLALENELTFGSTRNICLVPAPTSPSRTRNHLVHLDK